MDGSISIFLLFFIAFFQLQKSVLTELAENNFEEIAKIKGNDDIKGNQGTFESFKDWFNLIYETANIQRELPEKVNDPSSVLLNRLKRSVKKRRNKKRKIIDQEDYVGGDGEEDYDGGDGFGGGGGGGFGGGGGGGLGGGGRGCGGCDGGRGGDYDLYNPDTDMYGGDDGYGDDDFDPLGGGKGGGIIQMKKKKKKKRTNRRRH
nr:keratin, type I cytoskeletal 9-like [Onthophagus taurus]